MIKTSRLLCECSHQQCYWSKYVAADLVGVFCDPMGAVGRLDLDLTDWPHSFIVCGLLFFCCRLSDDAADLGVNEFLNVSVSQKKRTNFETAHTWELQDRFWWHLAEIFKMLYRIESACFSFSVGLLRWPRDAHNIWVSCSTEHSYIGRSARLRRSNHMCRMLIEMKTDWIPSIYGEKQLQLVRNITKYSVALAKWVGHTIVHGVISSHFKLNLIHHLSDCLRISRSTITQFGASVKYSN